MKFLGSIILDLRYALRTLRNSPSFTIVAALTLALGIGANTAIYSVIDGVLLHPIPFPESGRLVSIYQTSLQEGDRNAVAYPNLLDWQHDARAFEAIAGWRGDLFALTGRGQPEQLMGMMVSADFFSVLRVQPLLGRTFTRDEDRLRAPGVLLLGEDFWRRKFASDSRVIGQNFTLNGRDYAVIGVVPASIRLQRINGSFLNDVFVPIGQYDDKLFYDRGVGNSTIGLARLKSGVTVAQAQAEMNAIMMNLGKAYPDKNRGKGARVIPLKQDLVGDFESTILALAAAVGFVLLIACTNVANLALARSTGRTREFAVRIAIGAGRNRLMRQLLTESALLSILGGAVGLLLVNWSTDAALAVLPSALPAIARVEINTRVLLFTFVVSVLTGILFGLAPAVRAARSEPNDMLKQGGRGAVIGRHRTQSVLIVGEVTLTLVLLIGSGLMIRSLARLWNVNPGFDAHDVLTFYTSLSPERASTPARVRAALREINDRLSIVAGVESASVQIGTLPFTGSTTMDFSSENDPKPSTYDREALFYAVGPDHFKTMRIPLLSGRPFNRHDDENGAPAVIVDEELARSVFPGENPIGKHLDIGFLYNKPAEIVGLVGHLKHSGLDSDATTGVRSQIYASYMQLPDSVMPLAANGITAIVRSKTPQAVLLNSIRKELTAFDSGRAIHNERMMIDIIAASLAERRFSLILLGAFGLSALILSIVGVYGVLSYFVSQRTREIGLRVALGAKPEDIFYAVIGDGGRLAAIGVTAGLIASFTLTRFISSLLFNVSPTDLVSFAIPAAVLGVAVLLACYVPARRALRIDPIAALRAE
jgi:predicted permease